MDTKQALLPAALAAALFLAAPAWGAARDASTTPKERADSASMQSAAPGHAAKAQNHAQGEVNEECLREDPRKHPADVACAKLKSKRHPAMNGATHVGQAGAAGH